MPEPPVSRHGATKCRHLPGSCLQKIELEISTLGSLRKQICDVHSVAASSVWRAMLPEVRAPRVARLSLTAES